jgi:DNA-directed RNA polymerase specialized sigma24 family protein
MTEAASDFEEIRTAYRPRIRRHLACTIGADGADGLNQEVFFKIHRALDAFNRDSGFSTRIYSITTNVPPDRPRGSFFGKAACGEDRERIPYVAS